MGQYAKVKSDAVAVSMVASISDKLRKSEIHQEGRKKMSTGMIPARIPVTTVS
jgi:hypothetical protein